MKSQTSLAQNSVKAFKSSERIDEITHGRLPSSAPVPALISPLPTVESASEKTLDPGAPGVNASGERSHLLGQAVAETPLRASEEPRPPAGFVALSCFIIANGMTAEVKAAFRHRPHLVDSAPGYRRMEVISPLDRPEEIWLITFWADEASFRQWLHRSTYHESHCGIQMGLKPLPGETTISPFELVSS